MKKYFIALMLIALVVSATSFAQDALEAGEWNQIIPGGDTTCAYGEEYSFFVRPGDDSKLMIHFQGGGACWNSGNCRDGAFKSFDSSVVEDELALYNAGIFDIENPENPAKDFTQVVVTYCTGDIHVGNATMMYDDLEIQHKGRVNAEAVLAWVYENYPNPEEVFVNGCSAGSYGSIFFAPSIFEQYPDARHTQLGDAGVGVAGGGWTGFEDWGLFNGFETYYPNVADVSPTEFNINLLYEDAGTRFPDANFAQYTAAEDNVQVLFYTVQGGNEEDWAWLAQENFARLQTNLDNFASFTAAGDLHCVIPLPEFYTYETQGVRVVDWVADLVAGKNVPSVSLPAQ